VCVCMCVCWGGGGEGGGFCAVHAGTYTIKETTSTQLVLEGRVVPNAITLLLVSSSLWPCLAKQTKIQL
jgi:hypothetical protein